MTRIPCAAIPLWRSSPVTIPRSREAGKVSSAQALPRQYQEEEACILVNRDSEGNNLVLRQGILKIKGGCVCVCICVNCY